MVVGGQDDNYRALSGKTYEQRINVATSRAKDKLILFHSVQLGTDLNNASDLRYKLLNYIKNGITEKDFDENKKQKCDSKFEEDVFDWLVARGYELTPQVEVGAYRIDLVVEGENNRLAVECDGDRWHPPEKWWDDKLRQHQLERVGWTFWRVSGLLFIMIQIRQ
jgi:very-short-patch-repair endonuclease